MCYATSNEDDAVFHKLCCYLAMDFLKPGSKKEVLKHVFFDICFRPSYFGGLSSPPVAPRKVSRQGDLIALDPIKEGHRLAAAHETTLAIRSAMRTSQNHMVLRLCHIISALRSQA
eukprot:4822896-Amphidinium_carterae.1